MEQIIDEMTALAIFESAGSVDVVDYNEFHITVLLIVLSEMTPAMFTMVASHRITSVVWWNPSNIPQIQQTTHLQKGGESLVLFFRRHTYQHYYTRHAWECGTGYLNPWHLNGDGGFGNGVDYRPRDIAQPLIVLSSLSCR